MEITDYQIILTYDELRVLLYSQGFRSCEGVYMPEKEFEAIDIVNALHDLAETGIIRMEKVMEEPEALDLVFGDGSGEKDAKTVTESDGYTFVVRRDMLKILKIIGDPRDTEIIDAENGRKLYCYYSEMGIVTGEAYRGRTETVRLTLYDRDSFEKWRREQEQTI